MKNTLLTFILIFSIVFGQDVEIQQIDESQAIILITGLEDGEEYDITFEGQVHSFRTLIDSSKYILYNDFEHLPLGNYNEAQWKQDWLQPPWGMNLSSMVSITDSGSIRVNYPRARYALSGNGDNGALWYSELGQNYNEIYMSFQVYFKAGFEWAKGGKFHGLKWGNFNDSGRIPCINEGGYFTNKWIEGGKMVFYLYHPNQTTIWGDDIPMKGADGNDVVLEGGKWYTIVNYVRMNTGANFDGEIKTWIDGELVLSRSDFRFRQDDSIGIREFDFSTFFGGGDISFSPNSDQYIIFDNFKIYNP